MISPNNPPSGFAANLSGFSPPINDEQYDLVIKVAVTRIKIALALIMMNAPVLAGIVAEVAV